MNEPKSQQEPSMEEILASIRRIISKDNVEVEEGQDIAPREVVETPSVKAEEESTVDETKDEVLKLTEGVQNVSDDENLEFARNFEIMDVKEELEPKEAEPSTLDQTIAPSSDTKLISPTPSNAATLRISDLAGAVAGEQWGQSMGLGEHTIEDLVREAMRPMVKEWLDENLPALVERLVGREIDRIARRAVDGIDD